VVATIPLGGKPEFAVGNESGKLFVNLEDKSEIAVVDLNKMTLLTHWALTPGDGPTGLAIDIKTKRLFAGCTNFLVVVDAVSGKILDTLPIGKGCDGVSFDNKNNIVFASCGSGIISTAKEKSAGKFVKGENILTKKGARTICIDESTGVLYLPTADYDNTQIDEKGRPKMIAGSFQVIVVSKSEK
jgi:DNA-binding beta-propeller fold protein YncE